MQTTVAAMALNNPVLFSALKRQHQDMLVYPIPNEVELHLVGKSLPVEKKTTYDSGTHTIIDSRQNLQCNFKVRKRLSGAQQFLPYMYVYATVCMKF